MSVIVAYREYVNKMLSDVSGMKALLLDKETMSALSMVYSQSESNAKEVFLFQNVEVAVNDEITHLKAICFLKPTADNMVTLKKHLKDPKFSEYHLYFNNVLEKSYLKELAEADDREVVKSVHEFFADYYPVNSELFHLNIEKVRSLENKNWKRDDHSNFLKITNGILSTLLTFKKTPMIRYQSSSYVCQKLAKELSVAMKLDSLYEFPHTEGDSLLLIMDRKEDPVTPLLTQWTYQALVHECLGIHNNRVSMPANVAKEFKEVVLAPESDKFYKGVMFQNWGDVAMQIHDLVTEYAKANKSNQKLGSFEEMKKFVEDYPQFRAMQTNACKHMTVASELHKQIDERKLLEVSELEQELACTDDHPAAIEKLLSFVGNRGYAFRDKLRCVMIYMLRYERVSKHMKELQQSLHSFALDDADRNSLGLIRNLQDTCGFNKRSLDLFNDKSATAVSKIFEVFSGGFKGAESVLTQHKPLLAQILTAINSQTLNYSDFPALDSDMKRQYAPKFIIVFIHGGVTFEEAAFIADLNAKNDKQRIILGGTSIINSQKFLDDLTFNSDDHQVDMSKDIYFSKK